MNRNLSGLQFRHTEGSSTHNMDALDDGTVIGHLSWLKEPSALDPSRESGEILNLDVHPDYRRNGIATELYRRGKSFAPAPRHSPDRTAEGSKWAVSTGDPVPELSEAWDL